MILAMLSHYSAMRYNGMRQSKLTVGEVGTTLSQYTARLSEAKCRNWKRGRGRVEAGAAGPFHVKQGDRNDSVSRETVEVS
jgi:hypothetical protein